MVVACHDHSYVLNTQKAFLKIPSFTKVYLLWVCILFWQIVHPILHISCTDIASVPSLLFFHDTALIAKKEKVSQALSHFQTIIFMIVLGIHSRAMLPEKIANLLRGFPQFSFEIFFQLSYHQPFYTLIFTW